MVKVKRKTKWRVECDHDDEMMYDNYFCSSAQLQQQECSSAVWCTMCTTKAIAATTTSTTLPGDITIIFVQHCVKFCNINGSVVESLRKYIQMYHTTTHNNML